MLKRYACTVYFIVMTGLVACHPASSSRAGSTQAETARSADEQRLLDEQLLRAAYNTDLNKVRRLLADGANPNVRSGRLVDEWHKLSGSSTWTPMMACLKSPTTGDHYTICIALLDAGADINNAADSNGATALYKAIGYRSAETALMLIRRGAEVNTTTGCYIDGDEGSPLWWAVRCGNRPVVAALLRAGADTEARSAFEWTPLLEAVRAGDQWMVRALIEAGADVNAGQTYSIFRGDNNPRLYVRTPLLLSIIQDTNDFSNKIFRLLRDAGATLGDLEKIDVMEAFQQAGYRSTRVRLLVEQGLSPMFVNDDGETPAHWMAGNREMFHSLCFLLENNLIQVDLLDNKGDTPLSAALSLRIFDNAALLLEHGANPNSNDPFFGSYLHQAVQNDDLTEVALLLAYGADPTIKDHWDRDAVQSAEIRSGENSDKIRSLLRDAIASREDREE